MKVTETISIPPKPPETKEIVSHILCDLCGIVGHPGYSGEVEWGRDAEGDERETAVILKSGYAGGDGGHWNTASFHICPTCFRDRLVPWLESQGAKKTDDEIEW